MSTSPRDSYPRETGALDAPDGFAAWTAAWAAKPWWYKAWSHLIWWVESHLPKPMIDPATARTVDELRAELGVPSKWEQALEDYLEWDDQHPLKNSEWRIFRERRMAWMAARGVDDSPFEKGA